MKPLVLALMFLSLSGCSDAFGIKPDGEFKYYEYGSSTMREYPREFYRLEYKEGEGLTLTWAKSGSEKKAISVPDQAAEEVKALIIKHNLYRLKHMYVPPFDVRDGISWHVYLRIGDKNVSSDGENAWPPQRMRDGIEAINAYLSQLTEASSE